MAPNSSSLYYLFEWIFKQGWAENWTRKEARDKQDPWVENVGGSMKGVV